MPVRTQFSRTTHQWLQPLYNDLKRVFQYVVASGASGVAQQIVIGATMTTVQIGSPTGILGLYGFSGLPQIATGGNLGLLATGIGSSQWSGLSATGIGGSGLYVHLGKFAVNGGTGNIYTLNDVVAALKNNGTLLL